MKLGLISDTHGQISQLRDAIRHFKENGVELVIHCGDVTRPEHLEPVFDLSVPIHLVFGNMDRQRREFPNRNNGDLLQCHGTGGILELEDLRVGFTHGHLDSEVRRLKDEQPDYLFLGHTHQRRDETAGNLRIINPGSVKPPRSSAAILDLSANSLTLFDLQATS